MCSVSTFSIGCSCVSALTEATDHMSATAQQLSALERANHVRLLQIELKRQVRQAGVSGGRLLLATVLEDGPDARPELAMPVRRLLLLIPRMGEARVHRYLGKVGVYSGDRRVRDLSDRQRLLIAGLLREGWAFGEGSSRDT